LWSPNGASICEIPGSDPINFGVNTSANGLPSFGVSKVKWNVKGNNMILLDKTNLMLAFPGIEFMNSVNIGNGSGAMGSNNAYNMNMGGYESGISSKGKKGQYKNQMMGET
jgi:hypothetical protein